MKRAARRLTTCFALLLFGAALLSAQTAPAPAKDQATGPAGANGQATSQAQPQHAPSTSPDQTTAAPRNTYGRGMRPWLWIGVGIAAAVALLFLALSDRGHRDTHTLLDKTDRFGRLGNTNFFAAGDVVQLGTGQPLMVVNAVGDGKRVAFNLDRVLRGEVLQERTVPLDVITDLARMNMTYFPKFPRVAQEMLQPASRRRTQDEVIQAFSEEQAIEEASRCFSCGTCNACDNCYLVCPEPCIIRHDRSNGLYKILVDYCKGCRVCIEECPTGCLEGVPELDFDTGVVRMDTAFAITQGLHGRQAEQLKRLDEVPAKNI